MNYYAPNWVRYGSLKFSNPAKIEDFPAEGKNLEFERWGKCAKSDFTAKIDIPPLNPTTGGA